MSVEPSTHLAESLKTAGPNTAQSWRLYVGATIDNPVEGMYSFFPCLLRADARSGFPRPAGTPGSLPLSAKQVSGSIPQTSVRDCSRWRTIVDQVSAKGPAGDICRDAGPTQAKCLKGQAPDVPELPFCGAGLSYVTSRQTDTAVPCYRTRAIEWILSSLSKRLFQLRGARPPRRLYRR